MIRRHPYAAYGLAQFDAGVINEDQKVHAVAAIGSVRYALCRRGRIRFTIPAPFRRTSADACEHCALEAQPLG